MAGTMQHSEAKVLQLQKETKNWLIPDLKKSKWVLGIVSRQDSLSSDL